MSFFTNYQYLCLKQGKSPNGVAKELGLPSSSVTQWKNGSTPRDKTLNKIADYFHVSVSYLVYGEQKETPLVNDDEELTEMLERVRDNPHLRMLFSLTKDATTEDIKQAVKIIQALKGD